MNQAGTSAAGLGTLSISLIAEIKQYRQNMLRAIALLRQFQRQAQDAGARVSVNFQGIGQQAKQFGKDFNRTGHEVRSQIDQTAQTAMTRGKQGLGAVLDFSQGLRRFLTLNLRWFVIWRSFWAIWGQVRTAVTEFRDLMQETALALRTGVTELGSYVEKQMLGLRIQQESIKATMRHAIIHKDYIKSFYYLTTAGISAADAFNFVNDSIKTAIALDEEHETTVRLLTGLYNVFGDTITGVGTRQEAFQKISAILTETFRRQDIELADYAKALPYVAEQWKLSGNSLEVLVAALGVMGTHFMRGSKAATSLTRALSALMRYPERFAELTGRVFDPKKPLDFVAVLHEMVQALKGGTVTFEQMGFSAEEMGQLFRTLQLRGARAGATLIDSFSKLEDQIRRNYSASFELVEQMARMAELTVPRQLEIMGNILRGWVATMLMAATRTADFASALEKVNSALRAMTPIFETIGGVLRPLTAGLGNLIATLGAAGLAWKGFGKGAAVGVGGATQSLRGFFRGARRIFRSGGRQLASTAAAAGARISRSFLGRFFLIVTALEGILGLIQFAWSKHTGRFEEEARRHSIQLINTETSTWKTILSIVGTGLNAKEWAFRYHSRNIVKDFKKHEKEMQREWDALVEAEIVTREEADREMHQWRINYQKAILGEQFTHEDEMALARQYGIDMEKAQFKERASWIEKNWARLLDQIMKANLNRWAYQLWALKQQRANMVKDAEGDQEAVEAINTWFEYMIEDWKKRRRAALKKEGDEWQKNQQDNLKKIYDAYDKAMGRMRDLERDDFGKKIEKLNQWKDEALDAIEAFYHVGAEYSEAAATDYFEVMRRWREEIDRMHMEAAEKIKEDARAIKRELTALQEFTKRTWESVGQALRNSMADALFDAVKMHGDFTDRIGQIWQRLVDYIIWQMARLATEEMFLGLREKAGQPGGLRSFLQTIGAIAAPAPELPLGPGAPIGGTGAPSPAGKIVGMPANVTVVNVVDPSMIPAGMLRNRAVAVNIINEELMNRGSTYQIIKGLD